MSQYVETPTKTFQAAAASAQFLRAYLTGGKAAIAGVGDKSIGVFDKPALAADDYVAIRMNNAQGTRKMVASGAITKHAVVYGAASGKISATANANPEGIAMEAATTNGDIIEVLPLVQPNLAPSVAVKTADYTVLAGESGMAFTTVGAAGTVVFALPAATVGLNYKFKVGAAQELRIDPNGTETIALPSTGVQGAAGKYLTANAAGETVFLFCDTAGTWSCYGFTGTWTAEA